MELLVTNGPDAGARLLLVGTRTIGRDTANDLVLTDSLVSGRHAVIRIDSAGVVQLTDLSSRNGTRVNGLEVLGPTELSAGSIVQIGNDLIELVGQPLAARAPNEPLRAPVGEQRDVTGTDQQVFRPSSVRDAGPVAGRDVAISGQQAAGRDLHYHEGFRIRSRMRPAARRLLRMGLFAFVLGIFVGFGGFAIYGSELISTITEGMEATSFEDQPDINTGQLVAGLIVLGIGAITSLVGIVMMLVAAVMRRDQVREPIGKR